MGMYALRLQSHKIYDIDDPDFQLWKVITQDFYRRKRFQSRHVTGAGHNDVRLATFVVAGPTPNADSRRAMFDGGVHIQPLRRGLFARNNDVDIVAAPQAMIGDRQESIGIRWQIDTDDLGLLIHRMIDEAWVLMAEAIVVLPPDMGSQQIIQRSDRPPPGNVARDLEPFRMLIEHGIDNVNERLVAGKESVPASEQISLQPALA